MPETLITYSRIAETRYEPVIFVMKVNCTGIK
jgi:hypothetical protein